MFIVLSTLIDAPALHAQCDDDCEINYGETQTATLEARAQDAWTVDVQAGDGSALIADVALKTSGTYTIVARGIDSNNFGSYTITLDGR